MRHVMRIFIVVALLPVHANAGNIYVLGDITTIFDTNGRVNNHIVHPGNIQLFKNLRSESRDGASSILMLSSGHDLAEEELDYFYTGINDIVRIESRLTELTLSGVGLVVIMGPTRAIDRDEISAIAAHLNSSGDLLLMGDLAINEGVNMNINEVLLGLGSSMSIDLSEGTVQPFASKLSENPLVEGIESIKLSAARIVNGGTPLAFILRQDKHESILSYEVYNEGGVLNAVYE